MGLKIKDEPQELKAGEWDTIWPGDSAVDQTALQLGKWIENGGKDGIVLNGDEQPDIIKCRKLEPDEMRYIAALTISGDTGKALVAVRCFQIGVKSIDGMRWVAEERAGGIIMMPRKTLNRLMQETVIVESANGTEVERTLPELIGEHIFRRSFRE